MELPAWQLRRIVAMLPSSLRKDWRRTQSVVHGTECRTLHGLFHQHWRHGSYSFRAVDTTLVTVRWNTATDYDALWALLNVSDMPITGTITVIDMNGQVLTALQLSIPPGGRVARSSGTSDVNVPRNTAGSALFSHNGPPNSVMAEAPMIGPTSTLPQKFEALTPR